VKKVIAGLVIAAAAAGGGFYVVSNSAQTAAEEAILKLEKDIETAIPGSDFTFGQVKADVFARNATVEDLALKVDGIEVARAAALKVAGDDATIKLAELSALEIIIEERKEMVKVNAERFSLADADTASIKTVIETARNNPLSGIDALDTISFGDLNLTNLSFSGIDRDGNEVILVNANFQFSGVKNGAAEKISLSGLIDDKAGVIERDAFKAKLGKLNISGLRFASLIKTLLEEDEERLLAEMKTAFGISNVSLEGVDFISPEEGVKVVLSSSVVEIADSIVEKFSLRGLNFENKNENVTAKIEEIQFKGLDLASDFTSEKTMLENSAKLYGLTDIGITNASFKNEDDEVAIAELSLTDVAFEDGMIVRGKTSINGLRLPLSLIKEMDRSMARTIRKFTESEYFVLSLSNSMDFQTAKRTFDYDLEFGAEGFGNIKIAYDLADLDVSLIKKATQVSDFFEAMEIWNKVFEDISLSSIEIDYKDQQLADTLLAEVPDINELIMMSETQLDMILAQYPQEKEALKAAVKGFLVNKNNFNMAASAKTPVKAADLEGLFMSGELAKAITFTFSGS